MTLKPPTQWTKADDEKVDTLVAQLKSIKEFRSPSNRITALLGVHAAVCDFVRDLLFRHI